MPNRYLQSIDSPKPLDRYLDKHHQGFELETFISLQKRYHGRISWTSQSVVLGCVGMHVCLLPQGLTLFIVKIRRTSLPAVDYWSPWTCDPLTHDSNVREATRRRQGLRKDSPPFSMSPCCIVVRINLCQWAIGRDVSSMHIAMKRHWRRIENASIPS